MGTYRTDASKKRVALALLALLLWSSAWFALSRPSPAVVEIAAALDDPDLSWRRETLFLIKSHFRFPAPAPSGQYGPTTYNNPSRIRVLAIGDSFTYGWALSDPDSRWPSRLERELDAATSPGTFEVVSLAKPGSSAFTHAQWVSSIPDDSSMYELGVSSSDVPRLQEPFDAVVVGFVNNDKLPEDVPGSWDYFGKKFEVSPESYDRIISFDEPNPFEPELLASLSVLKKFAGTDPLLFAPLEPHYLVNDKDPVLAANQNLYKKAGFTVVDMAETRSVSRRHPMIKLMVTPADYHPSPALTAAYAKDVAAAILSSLPSNRLAAARAQASPATRPLISGVLPVWAEHYSNQSVSTVELDPSRSGELECRPDGSRGSLGILCGPDGSRMIISGKSYPDQHYPCALLGRPYVHVQTDSLASRTDLQVSVQASPQSPVDIFIAGYDSEGFFIYTKLKDSVSSSSFTIKKDNPLRAIVLASTVIDGCDPTDSYARAFSPMSLQISTER